MDTRSTAKTISRVWLLRRLVFSLAVSLVLILSPASAIPEEGRRSIERPGWWSPAVPITSNGIHDENSSLDVSGGYAHVAFQSRSSPTNTNEIYYKYGCSQRWGPAQRVTNNSVEDVALSMAVTDGFLVDLAFDSQETSDEEIYYKYGLWWMSLCSLN